MAVNIPGLIAVAAFYLIVLATGIWASRKAKQEEKRCTGTGTELTLVAGRNINIIVGIFTMTATWVGGGYILGTAATVYNPTKGLIWGLQPVGYFINFFVAGLFFAKHMRDKKYVTLMDPLQQRYGTTLTNVLLIPAMLGDLLFVVCIMASVGETMSIILDVSSSLSICISAAVAIIYTLLGGMFAVAYTDVIQLVFIFVTLWICVPFLILNPASTDIVVTAFNRTFQAPWVGTIEPRDVGLWMDDFLVLSLGGLGSQAIHQRILSAASSKEAQVICFAAAGLCFIIGIPCVLLGAVAASTEWNMTSYGSPSPYDRGEATKILPIALQHLTPNYISILGMSALAAAVMSSIDSCLLSCVSLFTNNLYKALIRKQATDKELQLVVKISVAVVGLLAMGLSFLGNNVLTYWFLASDVMYTMIFPQLVCALFCPISNGYGAMGGYILGGIIRLLSGEPLLHLPAAIHFPGGRIVNGFYVQHFPCRTLSMLLSLSANILISCLTFLFFKKGLLPERWDILEIWTHNAPSRVDAKRIADTNLPEGSDKLLDTSC